jgi:hypothetical protein
MGDYKGWLSLVPPYIRLLVDRSANIKAYYHFLHFSGELSEGTCGNGHVVAWCGGFAANRVHRDHWMCSHNPLSSRRAVIYPRVAGEWVTVVTSGGKHLTPQHAPVPGSKEISFYLFCEELRVRVGPRGDAHEGESGPLVASSVAAVEHAKEIANLLSGRRRGRP